MTAVLLPLAGVMGWPVAHSRSPAIHRFWLARLGIDGEYVRLPVEPGRLGAALAALPALGFAGVNLTVPHKEAAVAHLVGLDAAAAAVGAVNLVTVRGDGSLLGSNSDVDGILEPLAGTTLAGARAVVVGAGGAARAALAALKARDVGELLLLNRSVERAEALLAAMGMRGQAGPIPAAMPPCDLLLNASTLGMRGYPPLEPDLSALPAHAVVFDAVYAPLETPLLIAARARGLATLDGLAMLIGQARAAFRAFYGAEPPSDADAELRRLLTA